MRENTYKRHVFDSTIALKDNSLLRFKPELFDEWDFEKNDKLGLDIYKVSKGQGIKAWWICYEGHSYDKKICHKYNGSSCPYCSNKKLLKGYNDMWTTNPDLASLLANPEDGYMYMQCSGKKVDWKCQDCSAILNNKSIDSIKRQGLSCGNCSDGISYPEKVVFGLLNQLNVSFEHDNSQSWSKNKRFDFYIDSKSTIIETHGIQHSSKSFKSIGGRSLRDEKENDRYKKNLAISNGVKHYIELDCRYSDIDYIRTSILNSEISVIFDLSKVDWDLINKEATKSSLIVACKLWNSGINIKGISEMLKLNRNVVSEYLVKGNRLNICSYQKKSLKAKVVQLSKDNVYIKEWNSIIEASKELNITDSNISSCCNNRQKTAGEFKWLFIEDYEDCLSGKITPKTFSNIHGCSKEVVKIDTKLDKIEVYQSIKLAAKDNNLKNYAHISSCCKGNRKSAYGFRWMYKEDYEKIHGKL